MTNPERPKLSEEARSLLIAEILGDVGRVDELVTALFVALARVVLHRATDDSALGVEDGKS